MNIKDLLTENNINYLLLGVIVIIVFITYYQYLLLKVENQKIAHNFLSTTHAIGVIILYLWKRQPLPILLWSIPYFLYDSYLSGKYSKTKIQSVGLVAHHLIAIFMLSNTPFMEPAIRSMTLLFFCLLELSNIPYYIMGHLLNIKYDNKHVMQIVLLIQILTATIVRLIIVPLIPLLDLDMLNKGNIRYVIGNYLIYILSIYWTTNLWGQFIVKYNS
jgi:hypothetical protein